MSHKSAKALILFWSFILVLAVGTFAVCAISFQQGGFGNMFGWGEQGSFQEVKSTSITEPVNRIHLEWVSGNLTVLESPTDEIRVVQKAHENYPEKDLFLLENQNGTLTVKDARSHRFQLFWFSFHSTDLEVYLPHHQYEEFTATTTSANLSARNLTAKHAKLKTVSGDLTASGDFSSLSANTTSGQIDLSGCNISDDGSFGSTSGDILIHECTVGGNTSFISTSGDIQGSNVQLPNLLVNTTSGNTALSGAFGSVALHTTSGDLCISSSRALEELDASSVSGNIIVALSDPGNGFTTEFSKVSGSFSCDFPVTQHDNRYVYGDGGAPFSVRTTSGDFRIVKEGTAFR